MSLVDTCANEGFHASPSDNLFPIGAFGLQESLGYKVGCVKESVIEDDPIVQAEQVGVLVKQSLTDSFIVERRIKHFRQTSLQWVVIASHQTLLVVLIAREQRSHDFHHTLH